MRTARLEIHQLNVGQGDTTLIINRDVGVLANRFKDLKGERFVSETPVDQSRPHRDQGGARPPRHREAGVVDRPRNDEYGDDVIGYLERHGVVSPGTAWAPKLWVLVSHFHADHVAGLRSVFKRRVEERQPDGTIEICLEERYRPGRYTAD